MNTFLGVSVLGHVPLGSANHLVWQQNRLFGTQEVKVQRFKITPTFPVQVLFTAYLQVPAR